MNRYFRGALLALVMVLGTFVTTGYCVEKVKVGIAFEFGGMEQDFNALAYEGAQQAAKELGGQVEVVVLEPTFKSTNEGLLRNLVRLNCDLVIGIGDGFADPISKVARTYPRVKFALVDASVPDVDEKGNLLCLAFKDQEGAYLAGVAAALKSKTGKIGFVGAMDVPVIAHFRIGYTAGAKSIDPDIIVLNDHVGDRIIAYKNAYKAKEIALLQIQKGADVIYHAAGFAGIGIIEAATSKNILAIGVDVDQSLRVDDNQRKHLLTSTIKHIDTAVYDTVKAVVAGTFRGGSVALGLKEGGVDYAVNPYNTEMISDIRSQLNQVKDGIVAGEIIVPVPL